MNLRHIWAIFRKDLRDAMRDSRVLIALVLPLGLGLLYSVIFQNTSTTPSGVIAYVAADTTTLPKRLQAALAPVADITLLREQTAADARTAVSEKRADVALLIPAGFDASVANGGTPDLLVVGPTSQSTAAAMVLGNLDTILRQMAGQQPPATVQVETITVRDVGFLAIYEQVGLRQYFTLASTLMMLGMIAMFAVPLVLGEEREKKTLDALVLVASYPEVVVAKALLGIGYIVIATPLLLGVTRVVPPQMMLFATSVALLSVALIGFGLLMGALLTANQVNTWGSLLLLPIILPPFFLGMDLPPAVHALLSILPSSQAMQLMINSVAQRPLFPNMWVSYLIIAVWGVLAYGLLFWRLSRREG